MKLGFTATQLGLSEAQRGVVPLLLVSLRPDEFHHGDCVRGDEAGHALAREYTQAWIVAHPGDIATKRAHCQADEMRPVAPTLERNRAIVDEVDLLLACPAGPEYQRSGTWATVRYARKQGKPIIIVYPDGEI
ncbi:MAG: hypothetical protein HGA45_36270, partial [Chloroflexales bacterium]|nr:hypothetical protein [Chloroflexales bacterium]